MRINKSLNLSNYSKLVAVFTIIALLQTQIMGINGYISISTHLQIQNSPDETSSNRFEGYNLLVLEQRNYSTGGFLSRKIVITDLDGNTIIEREISSEPELADQPIEFINSTTLLYGDYGGAKLWNIETNVTVNLYFEGHHEIEMDYLRNAYFTLEWYEVDIEEESYRLDLINEYNSSGHLIRSIDTRNYIELWQTCPFRTTA